MIRFIIGIGDGYDHREMAELPEVHIRHLLIGDSGFPKQGGKGFCPFRFFTRNFGKGGWLNQPGRERCIEHVFPDAAARAATRAAWGVADSDKLAGFVGRLNHQKNPLFLVEVFAAMAQTDPAWKLLLVGAGEMEQPMREAAAKHGLTDRVLFAGVQKDVPAFMNAFDLFLLPSNFEGSPVTLVEAQGCGVPCLASTNVPNDGSVTDLVHFLPLTAPLTEWAAKANEIAAHGDHTDYWPTLAAAGYELKTAARRMEELYDRLGAHA